MIELTQNQIVDLFIEKMKLNGPSSHGTYNNADPTHYEKGTAEIGMMYGFSKERETNYPDPENVKVVWQDVTWGIEFEITTSHSEEKAYWSRPCHGCEGEWFRVSEKFFEVFKRILIEGDEKDFWAKDDDLSAMGYYSCR